MDHKAQRSLWKLRDVHDGNSLFNPTRLTVARKWNGLTKLDTAERVGVALRTITAYESGEFAPEDGTLDRLQFALGFGKEFFFWA